MIGTINLNMHFYINIAWWKNMKTKSLGFLICILLMLSISAIAAPITDEHISKATTFDDDVPTWVVGDSWTYTINNFIVDYNISGRKMFMEGNIDDFELSVADTSGGSYKVDFTGKLTADYVIFLSSPSMTLDVEGNFQPTLTRLTGTIYFSKTNLDIQDISGKITGITMVKFSPIPISLPIPFKLTLGGKFSTDLPIFNFPLSALKTWPLPEIDIEMNAQFGGIFGLIKIPVTFTTPYPWIPLAFWCWSIENITVEAGSFDAWRISSIIGDFFEYYYAPSVGNLVKVDVAMPNGSAQGELKSSNVTN